MLGLQLFIGAGAGVLGAGFSTWLLQAFAFPLNFVYSWGIASIFVMISWGWLALTREPARPVVRPRQSNRAYLAGLPALIRQDDNYRHFLIARCLMTLGGMGAGFVTVSAVERWHVSDGTVGGFTIALLVGQTLGNLVIGFVADRFGHKLSMLFAMFASGLGYGLAWLAPEPIWFFGVFVLLGIGFGGVAVSGILMVMEFSSPELRPRYIGVTNTTVGLVAIVAPLLGTVLARFNYNLLFALGAAVYAVAFAAMYFAVRDPRFSSAKDAATPSGS